jgi:hypothetical protein
MKKFVLGALAAACLVATAAPAAAASIDIPANGQAIFFWGPDTGGNQSYGQIFTALDSTLQDYSLTLAFSGEGSAGPFSFVSQVFAWNGSTTTGPALYTSAVQQLSSQSFTTFNFAANLGLNTGGSYFALVTNQPGGNALPGAGMALMAAGTANDNSFRYVAEAPVAGANWQDFGESAQFHANFSDGTAAIPEPATWVMMLLGFGGLGAALRNRRRVLATA